MAPFASFAEPFASWRVPATSDCVPLEAASAWSMNSWSPAVSCPATALVPAAASARFDVEPATELASSAAADSESCAEVTARSTPST